MNKTPRRIAIVGGGAAGLIAAITAAREGALVTLFEKEERCGKKILVSGNGRCNISNTRLHVSDYFGERSDFVSYALKSFDFHQFKKFCNSIGLHLSIKNDGRAYPLSDEARSVQSLLVQEARRLHVTLQTATHITGIAKRDTGFSLHSDAEHFEGFDALLITSGSQAASQLGATDDGRAFATAFGHSSFDAYPSLVGLHLASNVHTRLAGLKLTAQLTLYIDREKTQTITGDLLFTKYGISGFATLDISQAASYALLHHQQVSVTINILPQFSAQELGSRMAKFASQLRDHTVQTLLEGMISTKLTPLLLKECGIDPGLTCNALSTKQIKQLLFQMTQWRFHVVDTHGFKHAEVSGGGINTQEIDPKTMASLKVKGLYFAGEVLDIVGKRGGFNFHFAWASGYLAAVAMVKNEL